MPFALISIRRPFFWSLALKRQVSSFQPASVVSSTKKAGAFAFDGARGGASKNNKNIKRPSHQHPPNEYDTFQSAPLRKKSSFSSQKQFPMKFSQKSEKTFAAKKPKPFIIAKDKRNLIDPSSKPFTFSYNNNNNNSRRDSKDQSKKTFPAPLYKDKRHSTSPMPRKIIPNSFDKRNSIKSTRKNKDQLHSQFRNCFDKDQNFSLTSPSLSRNSRSRNGKKREFIRTGTRSRRFEKARNDPSELLKKVPTRFRLNEASKLKLMDYSAKGSWSDLHLSETLVSTLRNSMALPFPNPMQLAVIPEILKPKPCILFAAETGSGKTLAYLLPIMHKLRIEEQADPTVRGEPFGRPRSIILVPSHELVNQVHSVAKFASHQHKLRVEKLSHSMQKNVRQDALNGPIDLLICTPAQFLKSELSLDNARHLVIDEGDTLLADDFGEQVKNILSKAGNTLESKIICSATIPISLTNALDELFPDNSMLRLGSPILHRASNRTDIRFIDVRRPGNVKLCSCEELIAKNSHLTTLIFCNSSSVATRIHRMITENEKLMDSLTSVPSLLHGAIPEVQRQAIMKRFQAGDIKYLICTDLASRGLDTTQVGHVIMYEFARNAIDFIHRIGRTGRLINTRGLVHCLLSSRDLPLAKALKHTLKSNRSFTSPK